MIKFRCHNCNKKIGVQEDYTGKEVWCPTCHIPTLVPEPDDADLNLTVANDATQYSVFIHHRAADNEDEIIPPIPF